MELLQIENRHGKIRLNDGVHKESADKLIEELDQLFGNSAVLAQMSIGDVVCAADDALDGVEVEINSPGGSVFEGHRIYNSLRAMSDRGVPITTTVNGLAASMGSVILMAGDTRRITKGSRIMIHEASTMSWGDAKTLRKSADMLEGISAEIAGVYAERTGGEKDAIRDLMHAETWMDASQAKGNGFVHSIVGEKEDDASNKFDTSSKGMNGILSKLFPDNANATRIEAEIAENDSLRTNLENSVKVIDAKDLEIKAKVDELKVAQDVISAHLLKIDEINAAHATADSVAQAKIVELEKKIDVSPDAVALAAAELLASKGHPGGAVDLGTNADTAGKVLSREAFNKLDPRGKSDFSKAGGKIK